MLSRGMWPARVFGERLRSINEFSYRLAQLRALAKRIYALSLSFHKERAKEKKPRRSPLDSPFRAALHSTRRDLIQRCQGVLQILPTRAAGAESNKSCGVPRGIRPLGSLSWFVLS